MPVILPRPLWPLLLFLPALAGLLAAGPARAATLIVTTTADGGAGSLRAEITAAAAGDTITFDPTVFTSGALHTITLTSGALPTINKNLTITGPGAGVLAIDGNAASRVFGITGGTVAISGLTLQNGSAPNDVAPFNATGGGIAHTGGSLMLTGCTLSGNTSPSSNGGGIFNKGTLTLTDCTFTGNSSTAAGGYGGAVYNSTGTATLTGCVLAGNSAGGGGACENNAGATLTLTGCTLTGNTAQPGGGVYNVGTLTLTDDVLYGDTGGETAILGGTVTATYCDVQQSSGVFAGTGNLNADPLFVRAAFPYDLHLQPGSPCFQAGVDRAATDHDGQPYGSPPTIGAFEITGPAAQGQGYVVTNTNDGGAGSLRAAIAYSNANASTTVTFDPIAFPAGATETITLTTGELDVSQSLSLTAPGTGLVLDGGGNSRVFGVAGGTVSLSGLTIQNGQTPSGEGAPFNGGGGGVALSGSGTSVTLVNCLLQGDVGSLGGGVYNGGGTLSLYGCTLHNDGDGAGGGVYNAGIAMLNGCSLSGDSVPNSLGGGVYNAPGAFLSLAGCTLQGDSAVSGGGVYNSQGASATLSGCVLLGDSASFPGSPYSFGGGVCNDGGTLTLTTCVLSNDSAQDFGGGVFNEGSLTLTACSFSGDSAPAGQGGGVYNNDARATLTDDVLYGDTGGEAINVSANGATLTATYCDVQQASGVFAGMGNINADPLFVSAATGDLHLQATSPCFQAGTASGAPATDHDGVTYGSPPTIGAFEITGLAETGYVVTNTHDSGIGSLRAAVGYADANGFTFVVFDPAAFPAGAIQTIMLTSGEMDVTGSLALTAPGTGLVLDSGQSSRIFGVTGGPVYLTGLTLQAGQAPGGEGAPFLGGGGALAVGPAGILELTDCTLSGNSTATGDGGGLLNQGMVTLTNCSVDNNSAAGNGGGVNNANGGTLTLTGGEFSDNGGINGSGFHNDDGGTAMLTGCTLGVNGGTPTLNGGGVGNDAGGVVTLTACTLTNNIGGEGGGVFNGGLATLTGCALGGNSATDGGGVASPTGTLTMTDDTFGANGASNDGGGVSTSGAAALTAVALGGNNAGNNGGGLVNGGSLTLTSCSFGGNSANNNGALGTGGAVYTVDGMATLTDDVLYGDTALADINAVPTAVPSEIAGSTTLTYCDVQGGLDGNDAANHVLNVDPQFTDPVSGDLHLPSTSPVIAQGTDAAPGFPPRDADGLRFFTPPAMGAYEGPRDVGRDTHVVWDNPNGRTIFWDVNAQGAHLIAGIYGPFQDSAGGSLYTATALSTGPDGVSHLLWTNPNGNTYLWTVQQDGSYVPFFYGPFFDDGTAQTLWKAVAVSTGGDGVTHLLWHDPDGRTIVWDVNTTTGAFTIPANADYAPQPGYTPIALASGPDGLSHILWNGSDGTTLLWNLDAGDAPTPITYPLMADGGLGDTTWRARAVSVGPVPAQTIHLLWNNPNSRTILWNVSPTDGHFTIPGNYNPFSDNVLPNMAYTAVSLATGGDDRSHFAWDNPDGNTFLWSVSNADGTHVDTFYPPFLDDGTTNTIWKAVAISAGVLPGP